MVFLLLFRRMTIVLCKELSTFSKEFTTCLTTAGVRVTPQLGIRCGWLITALGSSPRSAFCVCTLHMQFFSLGTDLLGQHSPSRGSWTYAELLNASCCIHRVGVGMLLTVWRRQKEIRFVILFWIFQNIQVLLKVTSLSPNSPVVHSSFEDVMCVFIYDLCWAYVGYFVLICMLQGRSSAVCDLAFL